MYSLSTQRRHGQKSRRKLFLERQAGEPALRRTGHDARLFDEGHSKLSAARVWERGAAGMLAVTGGYPRSLGCLGRWVQGRDVMEHFFLERPAATKM